MLYESRFQTRKRKHVTSNEPIATGHEQQALRVCRKYVVSVFVFVSDSSFSFLGRLSERLGGSGGETEVLNEVWCVFMQFLACFD